MDVIDRRGEWRWVYGMFVIIMPVALWSDITELTWLAKKVKKDGTAIVNNVSPNAVQHAAKFEHLMPQGKPQSAAINPTHIFRRKFRLFLHFPTLCNRESLL